MSLPNPRRREQLYQNGSNSEAQSVVSQDLQGEVLHLYGLTGVAQMHEIEERISYYEDGYRTALLAEDYQTAGYLIALTDEARSLLTDDRDQVSSSTRILRITLSGEAPESVDLQRDVRAIVRGLTTPTSKLGYYEDQPALQYKASFTQEIERAKAAYVCNALEERFGVQVPTPYELAQELTEDLSRNLASAVTQDLAQEGLTPKGLAQGRLQGHLQERLQELAPTLPHEKSNILAQTLAATLSGELAHPSIQRRLESMSNEELPEFLKGLSRIQFEKELTELARELLHERVRDLSEGLYTYIAIKSALELGTGTAPHEKPHLTPQVMITRTAKVLAGMDEHPPVMRRPVIDRFGTAVRFDQYPAAIVDALLVGIDPSKVVYGVKAGSHRFVLEAYRHAPGYDLDLIGTDPEDLQNSSLYNMHQEVSYRRPLSAPLPAVPPLELYSLTLDAGIDAIGNHRLSKNDVDRLSQLVIASSSEELNAKLITALVTERHLYARSPQALLYELKSKLRSHSPDTKATAEFTIGEIVSKIIEVTQMEYADIPFMADLIETSIVARIQNGTDTDVAGLVEKITAEIGATNWLQNVEERATNTVLYSTLSQVGDIDTRKRAEVVMEQCGVPIPSVLLGQLADGKELGVAIQQTLEDGNSTETDLSAVLVYLSGPFLSSRHEVSDIKEPIIADSAESLLDGLEQLVDHATTVQTRRLMRAYVHSLEKHEGDVTLGHLQRLVNIASRAYDASISEAEQNADDKYYNNYIALEVSNLYDAVARIVVAHPDIEGKLNIPSNLLSVEDPELEYDTTNRKRRVLEGLLSHDVVRIPEDADYIFTEFVSPAITTATQDNKIEFAKLVQKEFGNQYISASHSGYHLRNSDGTPMQDNALRRYYVVTAEVLSRYGAENLAEGYWEDAIKSSIRKHYKEYLVPAVLKKTTTLQDLPRLEQVRAIEEILREQPSLPSSKVLSNNDGLGWS